MGISFRFYLFAEDGSLRRIPRRIVDEMPSGRDAIPEFAGTRQRVAYVVLENEDRRPARILDARGDFWTFDDEGRINEGLIDLFGERMRAHDAVERARRSKVTDLRPEIKMRELRAKNEWTLTADDLDRIAADLWPGVSPPHLRGGRAGAAPTDARGILQPHCSSCGRRAIEISASWNEVAAHGNGRRPVTAWVVVICMPGGTEGRSSPLVSEDRAMGLAFDLADKGDVVLRIEGPDEDIAREAIEAAMAARKK